MRVLSIALASALALGLPTASQAQSRYVHANNSAYDTLDPHTVFDVARVATRLNFYDGLYRWVDNPPQLIPWLALDHSVSDDGLTWTFNLREDVAFHDGSLMTADDVVYSMERMLALASGAGALFQPTIEPGMTKALDEHTVSFTLKEPSAIFGSLVPDILVVNSDVVKENEVDGDWGQQYLTDNIAGSGSYMLQRYDPAIGFIGERNPDHFAGWGEKYYDEIEFRTVLETNTRIQGLMRGDYQGLDGYLAPDQVERLRTDEDVKILEEESMRVYHIAMHNGRPPLDDKNFRMAMEHAFDYEGYIDGIMQGTVTRNPTIVPGNLWGVPDVEGYDFDLEKAEEYLDAYKAEHGDEIRTLKIGTLAGFAETEQTAALMQNGLAQLGIDVEIESAPWPVISSNMRNPETMPDMVPVLEEHLLRRPEQLDRRAVRIALRAHPQCLGLPQSRGGQAAGAGAAHHRPGGARASLQGGDADGLRRRRWDLDLQHQVVRTLRDQRRRHPLLSCRQRPGHAVGLSRRRVIRAMPAAPRRGLLLIEGSAPCAAWKSSSPGSSGSFRRFWG